MTTDMLEARDHLARQYKGIVGETPPVQKSNMVILPQWVYLLTLSDWVCPYVFTKMSIPGGQVGGRTKKIVLENDFTRYVLTALRDDTHVVSPTEGIAPDTHICITQCDRTRSSRTSAQELLEDTVGLSSTKGWIYVTVGGKSAHLSHIRTI